jgi:exopolysaccharide biosynthesis polyprenyl glycosylphosphotransferase
VVADFVTVACALWVAHLVHVDRLATANQWHSSLGAAVAALVVVILFAQQGTYLPRATPMNIAETEKVVRGTSCAIAIATASCLYGWPRAAPSTLILGLVVMILLSVQRDIGHMITNWMLRRGYGVQRVLIYGEQYYSQFARLLSGSPHLGKTCIGFVHERSGLTPTPAKEESGALGPWSDLEMIAKERAAAEVFITARSLSEDKLADIARDCERLNLRLSVVLSELDKSNCGLQYELLGSVAIARYGTGGELSSNSIVKRTMDVVGASMLLILLLPLFALTAVLVKLDSKGPVFFRHERIGKDGKRFFLWKLRSMRVHTPPYERSPASDADPRLTRVGRGLRRLSIDELPQLINVLRGEMSLVGPRPEMPFIVQKYGPLEQRRLKATPGITGLWQISPARAMPIHENMEFDLFYIDHRNVFLDCAILLRTITAVIRGIGAA